MRNIIEFSLLILSVTGEYERKEIFYFNEEMDDTMVPAHDPIWWFVRSPLEEIWLRDVGTDYPRISIFAEELSNMLQFIFLGELEDVLLVLEDCPHRLRRELLEIRDRILRRSAVRYVNHVFQNPQSAGFHLNHLFGNGRFADEERPMEVVCDLSRLFST